MRRVIGIVVLLVVVAVGVGGYLFYRDASSAEEESADAALAEFRADAPAAGAARPGLPEQGVYELAVTGDETIGRGAISFDRDLPGSAPLIIRHLSRGYESETRYSDQHTEWVRYDLVDAPGRGAAAALVPSAGAYAEWAQTKISASSISRTQSRDWQPRPLRLPGAPEVGERWRGDYRSGDLRVRIESEVLRTDRVDVGGTAVPVSVIRSTQEISGEYTGSRTEHFWYSPRAGMVVRYQIESSLDGPTDLDLTVDQTLVSLTPQT